MGSSFFGDRPVGSPKIKAGIHIPAEFASKKKIELFHLSSLLNIQK